MSRLECPWYVSAHAVRRWQAIEPRAPRDFDEASDALIQLCAEVWHERYASGERAPHVTRTGAYVYRATGRHRRIQIIVSAAHRPEGDKHQVVDVVPETTARR